MKKANYYPNSWGYSPITSYVLAKLEEENRVTNELILKNTRNYNLGVSEMNLNATKLTAIDVSGVEHFVFDFQEEVKLNIKGIGYGRPYRMHKANGLPANTYTHMRFYLGKDNEFIFKDGVVEYKSTFDYLDFEIENNLTLNREKPLEFKIWFDMVPFDFGRHFKFIIEWFKQIKGLKTSLQGS